MRSLGWRAIALGLAPALLIVAPAQVLAGVTTVDVRDNAFASDRLRVILGGAVRWQDAGSGQHNVREDAKIFRSGAPTTNMEDFKVKFSAGTFHYYCEIHGSRAGGMDGVVRVSPQVLARPAGVPFTVLWAVDGANSGTAFDVQYKIGSGRWKQWKSGTEAVEAVFGKAEKPVKPEVGTRYSFRARSKKGSRASEWSPVKVFAP